MQKTLKIKYVHSPIGRPQKQKDTIRCLGFTRLHQVKSFPDTPCIRGIVRKIPHLVQVVD